MILRRYKGVIHSMSRSNLILIVALRGIRQMNMEGMEVLVEEEGLIHLVDSPGNNQ
jgi:hypothetical protein